MTTLYAIYGASGCGRSLMPVARQQLARQGDASEIIFIDDAMNLHRQNTCTLRLPIVVCVKKSLSV